MAESSVDHPTEEFDLVVLGSGEGSKFLAWTLAREGKRVAVVEQRWIGGSCPNIACLPSKNVIHTAKVVSYFARADEFGIETSGHSVNMAKVIDRKRSMVKDLVGIHSRNFESSGAELVRGHGYFVAPRTVEVDLLIGGKRRLRGADVVIGTGTHATVDATPGLAFAKPLTHVEALELEQLPSHLLILGGGYIGLEFAQAMRRLGSKVSVLDRNTTLLHREDPDVTSGLETLFREEGIDLILKAKVERVRGVSGERVSVAYHQDGTEKVVDASHLLVALGRTPNTAELGLDLAGVEVTEHGYVKTDERLRTSAEGVWAVGEIAGSPQFTHIAYDDFRILRENLAGGHRVRTGRLVPSSLFTDPELGARGVERDRGTGQEHPLPPFQDLHGVGVAHTHPLRDARLHEGTCGRR